MTRDQPLAGHLAALFTIVLWGTTYIATKVLLRSFGPTEILITRFVIGYATLLIMRPGRVKLARPRDEWLFVFAGLTGITLYYLLENLALTQTTASSVGIIVTISPFFMALLSVLFLHTPLPNRWFYIGFVVAMAGVILVSDHSGVSASGHWLGDALALLAALVWAVYSILKARIGVLNVNLIQATRHTFFYGIVFMLPLVWLAHFRMPWAQLLAPVNLGNFLFLGIGACAVCFVTWSFAVKRLGTVRTSVYMYLVPVITLAFSVWLLHEPLTPLIVLGAALTLVGLWVSGRAA